MIGGDYMVETLKEIMDNKKKMDKLDTITKQEIPLYLDGKEAKRLLTNAQRQLKRNAWVLGNLERYREEERDDIKRNATESALFWEKISIKLESQMR